jgi:hypothetical protein
VYDVASLSTDDAMAVLEAEGEPSRTRLYVRHDGAVMKTDCPVGVRRKWMRRALFATWSVMTCVAIAPWPPPRLRAGPTEADFGPVVDHAEAMRGSVPAGGFASSAGASSSSPQCREAGCTSGLFATIPLPAAVSLDQLSHSSARLCFNHECYSADLAPMSERAFVRFPGSKSKPISNWPVITLVREWKALRVDFTHQAGALHDGDVFSLTVRPTAGGPAIVQWRERATYSIVQPNGSACDPTCRVFRVDGTKQ